MPDASLLGIPLAGGFSSQTDLGMGSSSCGEYGRVYCAVLATFCAVGYLKSTIVRVFREATDIFF